MDSSVSKRTRKTKRINVVLGCLFKPVQNTDTNSNQSKIKYEVLLTKRRDQFLAELDEKWELPGGKVEKHESEAEAVEREVLEETGYKVKAIEKLPRAYFYIRDYPNVKQETTVTCFKCVLTSRAPNPIVLSDSKIEEYRWFDPNNIDFRNTLQGSREFIVDVANSLGSPIEIVFDRTSYLAVFEVVDRNTIEAVKRFGRKYTLTIQFLSNSNAYIILTDFSGKKRYGKRDRIEQFEDYYSMLNKAKVKIADRQRHGYSITYLDKEFPLLEWMNDRNFPITPKKVRPAVQLPLYSRADSL